VRHPGILNDVLFKIVFGTQAGEPILRALVNALLDLDGEHKIVALTLLNPISEKEFIDDKGPILDLKARDQLGRQYNVEVQLSPGLGDYIPRSLYYVCKFFSDQIQRGDSYHQLLKTVSISLLDFDLFPEPERVHSRFTLREKGDSSPLCDLLELHYIELRKFRPNKPQQLQTRFERWLYFLKFADTFATAEQSLPESLHQEDGIPMALDSMRRAYANDPIRELIEAREKAHKDELNRLHTATREGEARGLAKGLAEGLAEGKARQLEAARALLASGVDAELIERTMGFTLEQLEGSD
jgi:predicted transposase/invertase (TIGR01784 family)